MYIYSVVEENFGNYNCSAAVNKETVVKTFSLLKGDHIIWCQDITTNTFSTTASPQTKGAKTNFSFGWTELIFGILYILNKI